MSRELRWPLKALDDMTPEEKVEYIEDINDLFVYSIDAAPFVEVGEREGMQYIKLRSHIHEGKYSVGEMIFELQMDLYRFQQRNSEQQWKMIVSKLELTPDMRTKDFCPLMGVMIKIKFEER